MTLPRTILVATGFSAQAEKATRYAVELGRAIGARVALVHGSQPPPRPTPEMVAPLSSDLAACIEDDARHEMERTIEKHGDSTVLLTGYVICSDGGEAAIETAERLKPDLIVLGTHDRRGFERALLGSVAESVARRACCPVLVVR